MVGTNCLKTGGQNYTVEKYIIHEDFKPDARGNDIAVIRVKGKIDFNNRVRAIKYTKKEFPDDVEAQLTGWGRLEVSI